MKNKKLTIRVTEFERRQLEQEANRRGMTQSELIRSLIARFRDPIDPVRDSSLETKPDCQWSLYGWQAMGKRLKLID
ncbi:CopG family transcriptional regulator [Moorena sp. SIO4G3]|uniref:ribbon-helix-helix domain-containing protein n=1 Tax=Moorena sp. SIO4G3 TaxID=2607821 RepID=UPI0025FE18CD|nr:CopG family transcriptional regulator [Moorena sp. SIO4G3]